MKTTRSQNSFLLFVYLAALLLLGVMGVVGWAKYLSLRVSVSIAEQQTRAFQEFAEEATHATPEQVRRYIENTKSYAPSPIILKEGSHLDLIVERARSLAISNMQDRVIRIDTR